jgi:ABC-2 type transport system permease protein
MMFLAGTFLPVAAMPAFVQAIARVLPLYYMANGLRDTTVRGLSITHVAPDIGVLLGVTAILSVIALRSFRWEPSI